MAEERFDQPSPLTPLSEKDLAPIEPLTAGKILNIGQKYVDAAFRNKRLGRRVEAATEALDADILDELNIAGARCSAFKEVLQILGQGNLTEKIDNQVEKMFGQT